MTKINTNIIASNIKFLRKDVLDMSQEDFGKLLGTTRNVINSYERKSVIPRTKFLINLHDQWNMNTQTLLSTKMTSSNLKEFKANPSIPFGNVIEKALSRIQKTGRSV